MAGQARRTRQAPDPDTVDHLTARIDKLSARITTRLIDMSTTAGDTDDGGPWQGMLILLTDVEGIDEIPGAGRSGAQRTYAYLLVDHLRWLEPPLRPVCDADCGGVPEGC